MKVLSCLLVMLVGLTALPNTSAQLCLAEDIEKNTEFKYKARLYKGLTIFTANFLDAMHKANPNENLFFSPFSLYHALLLAYFGSGSQTEKGLKVKEIEILSQVQLINLIFFSRHLRQFSNFTGLTVNPMSLRDTSLRSVFVITTKQTRPSNSHQSIVFISPKRLS